MTIKGLTEIFKENANQENALQMKAYMKGHFEYFGIKSPDRRAASTEWLSEWKTLSVDEIFLFCKKLWEMPEREYQMTAMDLLSKVEKRTEEKHILEMEWFIQNKSWWDTVDWLSSHLVGNWVFKFDGHELMEEWNSHENMWMRRASIIYQINRKNHNLEVLQKNCKNRLNEKEFFIRKAIGWVLRDVSRKQPEFVIDFVRKYKNELSPLSYREATKYLNISETS